MTRLGVIFYSITIYFAKLIIRYPIIYYLLSFTWGIVMTIIGLLVSLVLLFISTPIRYNLTYYFQLGEYWGGITLGMMFITDKRPGTIPDHEFGHTVQNCIYGPLFPFLIALPSLIRANFIPYSDYDAIWFEKSATKIGKMYKELRSTNDRNKQ